MMNLSLFIIWLPNVTVSDIATGMGVRKVTGKGDPCSPNKQQWWMATDVAVHCFSSSLCLLSILVLVFVVHRRCPSLLLSLLCRAHAMVVLPHGDVASWWWWCCVMVVVLCCDDVGVVMLVRSGGMKVGWGTYHGVGIQRTMVNDGDASFIVLLPHCSWWHGNFSPPRLSCRCGWCSFGWWRGVAMSILLCWLWAMDVGKGGCWWWWWQCDGGEEATVVRRQWWGRRQWWVGIVDGGGGWGRRNWWVDDAQIKHQHLPRLDLGIEDSVPVVPGAILSTWILEPFRWNLNSILHSARMV